MNQDEIVAFLSSGASYGLPGLPVTRIETHGSIVFLVGDNAYKLKRPVAFSALDYTTVERREVACRREVELNRRTAPDLYLGVRAVCRGKDGALTLDGVGPVVDWIVAMRRFEQADLFDNLAAANRLSMRLMSALADEIARFHAGAQVADASGGAQGLGRAIEQNRTDQSTVESVLKRDAIERLYTHSMRVLDRVHALLDRRRANGRVRVCHGDLRLANICLYHGRPTLFDAIEFAENLSCVDVLYDLAFLLMDLEQRGLHAEANLVFNRYLDMSGDSEGLSALPLMISVRAGIRAYGVAASSMRKTDRDESRRLVAAAHALMNLAASLLETESPRLVALDGGIASDRDALAVDLASRFKPSPGARILRTKMSPHVEANAAVISEVINAGYTAIIDAPFRDGMPSIQGTELAAALHVPFVGLWLGEAQAAPASWQVVDRGHDGAALKASACRATGTAASRRGPGDS